MVDRGLVLDQDWIFAHGTEIGAMQYLQGKSENLSQSDLFVGPPLNKNYSDEGSRNFGILVSLV